MCITQLIESIISFRLSFRRKRMLLHLIASIYDISHDRFCRCDVNMFCDRNAHCVAFAHCRALFCTCSCRSCARLFLRFQRHLHLSFRRRLHSSFHLQHFCVLTFESHHFVSLFCISFLKHNSLHIISICNKQCIKRMFVLCMRYDEQFRISRIRLCCKFHRNQFHSTIYRHLRVDRMNESIRIVVHCHRHH